MSFAYEHNPTRVTDVTQGPDETCVELAFDLETAPLPWRSLDPRHPVVIEKLQYLSGMTALMATGGLSSGQGSALTEVTWSSGDGHLVGHAARGVCRLLGSFADLASGEGRFELSLYDAAGVRVADLTGAGVVFDARESGARRAAAKAKARSAVAEGPRHFVDNTQVGLPTGGISFLGPIGDDAARALVSRDRAFHPAHPFHTGSGDHVNAGHLLDVVFQFAHLVIGRPLTWVAGSARFRRFVELDVPFVVKLEDRRPGSHEEALAVTIHQLERPCAEAVGTFRSA